jgi:hypothetical protein
MDTKTQQDLINMNRELSKLFFEAITPPAAQLKKHTTCHDRFEYGMDNDVCGHARTLREAFHLAKLLGDGAYVFDRMARRGNAELYLYVGDNQWKRQGKPRGGESHV